MPNQKRLESAARIAVSNRNYRRARARALTRLAQTFPEQYKELLESEKLNDEILGKKWADLDGNTVAPVASTYANATASGDTYSEREGNEE